MRNVTRVAVALAMALTMYALPAMGQSVIKDASNPFCDNCASQPMKLEQKEIASVPAIELPQELSVLNELTDRRDRTSKHFAIPNGDVKSILTAGGSLHYLDGGEWKDIDNALVTLKGVPSNYAYTNKANAFQVYYPAFSNSSIMYSLAEGSVKAWQSPVISWQDAQGNTLGSTSLAPSAGTPSGNKLVFPGVMGDIDARFTQHSDAVELDYVINGRQFINQIPGNAEYLVFSETIEFPAGWSLETTEGREAKYGLSTITIMNKEGVAVLKYQQPYFYDNSAHKASIDGGYEIEQSGNKVTIKTLVPTSWLMAQQREFPITIDPTTSVYPNNTLNWTGRVYNDGGKYDNLIRFGRFNTTLYSRGWSKFNTTTIPDANDVSGITITFATSSYASSFYSPTYGATLAFSQLLNDPQFRNGILLYNDIMQAGYTPIVSAALPYSTLTYYSHTITSSQAFTDLENGLAANWFALGFMPQNNNFYAGDYIDVFGRNTANPPYLEVTHAPASSCAAGTAAAASGNLFEPSATASLTLTGSTGSIQWQTSPNGSTGWTSVSGGTGATSTNYISGTLTQGTYYYRAQVTDGGSCTENSNVVTITVYPEPFFTDDLSSGTGWTTQTAQNVTFPGYETRWLITNCASYNIDGTSNLQIVAVDNYTPVTYCGSYWEDMFANGINARKQITGSAGYTDMTLYFDWKCFGERVGSTNYDYGEVGYSLDGVNFTWMNTSVAGAIGHGFNNQGTYVNSNSNNFAAIPLPASLNNQSFYVAFRWFNDNAASNYPAFIVDNIRVTGTPVALVCAPVSNLTATIGSPANGPAHHMNVTWDALTGATSYDVEYSTDGSNWNPLATVTTNSYDHNTGDNPNAPYYYRVRGKNSTTTCNFATMATPVYTAADIPAAPTVNNITSSTMDVTLVNETPVNNPAITTYSIQESNSGDYVQANGTLGATEVFLTKAAWGTVTVNGLNANSDYCFVPTARNNDGHVVAGQTPVSTLWDPSGVEDFTSYLAYSSFCFGGTISSIDNWMFCTLSGNNGSWGDGVGTGCNGTDALEYTSANASNGSGSVMHSARFDATGQNEVTVSFDFTNSFNASYLQDRIYLWVSDWNQSGWYQVNTGTPTQSLYFDVARNCERMSFTFDITSLTNKNNLTIGIWSQAQAGSASHNFQATIDNMSVNYISAQTCATTASISAPDLVVQSITPSVGSICGNATVNYDVVVQNAGVQPITAGTAFTVEAFTGGLTCGGTAVATQSFNGGLGVGATTTLTFSLPLSGNSNVSFEVDAANNITEQDEANNCAGDNSVTVTSGLSGTYTIGGTSPDYASWALAVADLNSQGVCGPVVFNVRTGTYTENIVINNISGVSATNTVTFQAESGNAADVALQSSAFSYVVDLNGAGFVTFNELTINYIGTSSYGSFRLRSKADNNTITNCVLNSSSTQTSSSHSLIYVSQTTAGTKIDYLTIEDNVLNGSSYGIYYRSGSSTSTGEELKIIGNTFNDQISRAIYILYGNQTVIDGNMVNKPAGITSYIGLELNQLNNGASIQANNIVIEQGTRAMDITNSTGTSVNPMVIANNMMRLTSTQTSGLRVVSLSSSSYVNFYYNTFSYHQSNANYFGTSGLYISGNYIDASLNIVNNIFTNTSGLSSQVGIFLASTNNIIDINSWDYNNYYFTAGASNAAYYSSNYYATSSALNVASGKDANSIDIDPLFVSATDLHVTASGLNVGTPIAGITTDIDGQTRQTPPYIGADEAISCVVGVWTAGGGNNEWFNTNNWSCNTVPTIGIDATIPSGVSVYPADYGSNTTVPVKSLTIETGASVTMVTGADFVIAEDLTVDAGGAVNESPIAGVGPSINLGGDLTVNGAFTNNSGKLILDGSAAQTITATIELNDLELDNSNGATINGSVGVAGVLGLRNGTLTTNNALTIMSDNTRTGLIDDFTSGMNGSLNGNVTVERYVANSANYFFYTGSPVAGVTMADWGDDFGITTYNGATDGSQVVPTATCDPTQLQPGSPYGTLFDYRENEVVNCNLEGWHVRTNGPILEGKGYIVRAGNGTVLDLSGPANTQAKSTQNLTVTSGNGTIHRGFNLISNPYPSPIDWLAVYTSNNTNIFGTAYMYQTSGPLAGTYVSVNSISPGSKVIGSSQAMFVEARNNNATVNFNNTMRTLGDNSVLRQSPGYTSKLTINLSGNGYNDMAMIAFGDDYTDTFDAAYDARKLNSSAGQPTLYTLENGERRSIHALPVNTSARVIPLNLLPGANGNFTMNFEDLNTFASTSLVYLEDLQTGVIQNLMVDDSYSFVASAADNEARFLLHFFPKAAVAVTDADCEVITGAAIVDLGIFNVNNTTIVWDTYKLVDDNRNVTIARGTQVNGNIDFPVLPVGDYSLTLTYNGYSATETFTVDGVEPVFALFETPANEVTVGQQVDFSNLSSLSGTYYWEFGDGQYSYDTHPVHVYTMPGTYEVTLTVETTTCTDTYAYQLKVEDTANGIATLGEVGEISITGYENDIRITFSGIDDEIVTVQVFDVIGNNIMTEEGVNTSIPIQRFRLNDIAAGHYIVRVYNGQHQHTAKVFLGSVK